MTTTDYGSTDEIMLKLRANEPKITIKLTEWEYENLLRELKHAKHFASKLYETDKERKDYHMKNIEFIEKVINCAKESS